MCVCERSGSTASNRLWLFDYAGAVNRGLGIRERVCGECRYGARTATGYLRGRRYRGSVDAKLAKHHSGHRVRRSGIPP